MQQFCFDTYVKFNLYLIGNWFLLNSKTWITLKYRNFLQLFYLCCNTRTFYEIDYMHCLLFNFICRYSHENSCPHLMAKVTLIIFHEKYQILTSENTLTCYRIAQLSIYLYCRIRWWVQRAAIYVRSCSYYTKIQGYQKVLLE